MHHVACARHASECAVGDISIQPSRLLPVDESVFPTSDDSHRDLKLAVIVLELAHSRDHHRRFGSTGPYLGRTDCHLLGKAIKLLRNWAWSKDFSEKQRPHHPAH